MSIVSAKNYIGCLLVGVIVFSSCSNNEREIERYKALNESLEESNKNITHSIFYVLKSLDEKLSEPRMLEMAKVWQPKAESIHKLSDDMINYLDGMKKDLLSSVLLGKEGNKNRYDWGDTKAVKNLLAKQDKYKELDKKMNEYTQNILNIDSGFLQNKIQLGIDLVGKQEKKQSFSENLFEHTTVVAAVAILNKFINTVMNTEYKTVVFCDSKVGFSGTIFYKYQPLISQSSNYVNAGDEIEIAAGVGSFSRNAIPSITINGKNISLIDGALAKYKFKTSSIIGKHNVPVKVEYVDQNGIKQIVTENVEYTVIKECE